MGSEQAALVEHGLFGHSVRPAHERFPGSLVKGLSVSTIWRTIVVVVVSPQRTRLRSQYWLMTRRQKLIAGVLLGNSAISHLREPHHAADPASVRPLRSPQGSCLPDRRRKLDPEDSR
jgi:hypothetical protein